MYHEIKWLQLSNKIPVCIQHLVRKTPGVFRIIKALWSETRCYHFGVRAVDWRWSDTVWPLYRLWFEALGWVYWHTVGGVGDCRLKCVKRRSPNVSWHVWNDSLSPSIDMCPLTVSDCPLTCAKRQSEIVDWQTTVDGLRRHRPYDNQAPPKLQITVGRMGLCFWNSFI